jgi:hypothetical protein
MRILSFAVVLFSVHPRGSIKGTDKFPIQK